MFRFCLFVTVVSLLFHTQSLHGQVADGAATGVELCDCLPADSYLLLKKTRFVPGQTHVQYTGNIEVLITFLGAYGHVGPHPMNLSWPNDLAVGSADLTHLLSGYNVYPPFEATLCDWEVVNVASHGWILEQIDAVGYSEAYIHESTYDEFDLGNETYGQCMLNSFDLEMVYLPDSVVRLSFVKKYVGNPDLD